MEEFNRIFSRSQRNIHNGFQVLDHFLGRQKAFRWTIKRRIALYDELAKTLPLKGKGRIMEVDRVKDISPERLIREYINKNKPVILEGAALEWNCVKNWGIDYFIEKHGDDAITVVGEIELDEKGIPKRDNYESTLKKELEDIKRGGKNYYKFYPLFYWHPETYQDIDKAFLKKRSRRLFSAESLQVFIGAKDTFTNFHNASASNFFIQVVGEKEWYLAPNYYRLIFDPSPTDGMSRGAPVKTKQGPFDPFSPSFEKPYHLFEFMDMYHMVLKPGDIFYNPPYYWHAVKNNSFSIGMGYRWYAPSKIWKASPLYFFLDFFSSFWWKVGKSMKDINLVHKK